MDDDRAGNDEAEVRRRRAAAATDLPPTPPTTTAAASRAPNANDTNNNQSSKDQPTYRSTAEYCQALNQWMLQCYYTQCMQQMSYPLLTLGQPPMAGSTSGARPFVAAASQVNAPVNGVVGGQRPTDAADDDRANVYILPKIWKRCLAEVIDFLFLLVLKVIVTYIAIDYFDLVDLAKYEINLLEEEFDAYQLAYELTSEILIIESIHRLLVIIFETMCLARSPTANRVGGATPGKALLGLKVISCNEIVALGNGTTVRVTPARDIGFTYALLRALIKNLSSGKISVAARTVKC